MLATYITWTFVSSVCSLRETGNSISFQNAFIISCRSSWLVFVPLLHHHLFSFLMCFKIILFWLKHGDVGTREGDFGMLGLCMYLRYVDQGKASCSSCYYSCSSLQRRPWEGRVPGSLWSCELLNNIQKNQLDAMVPRRQDKSHRSVTRRPCPTSFYSLFHYFKKVILIKRIRFSWL